MAGGLGLALGWLGFVQRRSRGDGGGLKIFSGRGREVLIGSEPLIQFGIASKASAENLALHLGEFELLIADRVAGSERCFGERNLIGLPGEIAKGKQSIGGELVE